MTHEPAPPGRAPRAADGVLARVPMILLYGVLGLIVGVLGSFTHRSRLDLFGTTVWYGIAVALACVVAFAVGLRAHSRERSVSLAFAAGVVVGVLFIALGVGHSVVIVGDLVGLVWLVAAPLLAFGVAFWPRLERPATSGAPEAAAVASAPAAPAAAPAAHHAGRPGHPAQPEYPGPDPVSAPRPAQEPQP